MPAQLGTPDAEAALTGIYTGALPYARLFELARVLLDAAAEGDAPAREAADILADEIAAFVRAAVVRLDVQDEAVEVVLGGGIFDTTDAAFHARVAAGIHAVAPRRRLVRLDAPPVLGAALIGLDAEDAPLGALRRAAPGAAAAGPNAAPGPRPQTSASSAAAAAAARTPAGTWGMASATRRSSSASSEWARSLTIVDDLGVLLGVPAVEELGQARRAEPRSACRGRPCRPP